VRAGKEVVVMMKLQEQAGGISSSWKMTKFPTQQKAAIDWK
jgi:hypothetical protein